MTQDITVDVAIVGGGMAGMLLANALVQHNIHVALIEKNNADAINSLKIDGRASAIAHQAKQILEKYGVWDDVKDKTGLINEIRVTDAPSLLHLHFHRDRVDGMPMGYMLQNTTLLQALYKKITDNPAVTLISETTIENYTSTSSDVTIECSNGYTVKAQLLVGADGKFSTIRTLSQIPFSSWDYPQTAIVCTIEHEKSHRQIAQERFLPAGPFAILPLHDPYQSSIVWTETKEKTPAFLDMDETSFLTFFERRSTDYLGELTLASQRFSYPLTVGYAHHYYSDRTVLIGDAAHWIHPITGQGFNLGIYDIDALTDILVKQYQSGLNLGTEEALKCYEQQRYKDNMTMLLITDGFNRLFSNTVLPAQCIRRLGLSTVEHMHDLQSLCIQYAMGIRNQESIEKKTAA